MERWYVLSSPLFPSQFTIFHDSPSLHDPFVKNTADRYKDYILPKHPKKPAAEPVPATVPESTLVPEEVVAAGGEDEVVPPAAPAPAPAPAADPIVAEEESSGDVTQPLDFEEIL